MNTQGAGKTLPIILAVITLATALFFWKQRDSLRQKTQDLLSTPTPLISAKQTQLAIPTTSTTPTAIPQTSATKTVKTLAKRDTASSDIICTPVYGMANSCAEHAIVDTALDTTIFYNLAGISYLSGLLAFIKAKKRA